MKLIGEYAGIKREWIVSNKTRYREQAFEVIRLFHCKEKYFGDCQVLTLFEKMKEFAREFFPRDLNLVIDTAIEAGIKEMSALKLGQKQERWMSTSRWIERGRSQAHIHNQYSASTRMGSQENKCNGWQQHHWNERGHKPWCHHACY
jgi:hypothetical protein